MHRCRWMQAEQQPIFEPVIFLCKTLYISGLIASRACCTAFAWLGLEHHRYDDLHMRSNLQNPAKTCMCNTARSLVLAHKQMHCSCWPGNVIREASDNKSALQIHAASATKATLATLKMTSPLREAELLLFSLASSSESDLAGSARAAS